MVQTQSLTYKYPKGPGIQFPDLTVGPGEACLVLGQSGVGKTTFLHLMAGLMKPSNGNIDIGGKRISDLKGSSLDHFRGNNIGLIFQKNHFVSSLNLLDNLLLAQSLAGNNQSSEDCMALLERLNIASLANKKTSELSEGEKQRVSIARSLVNSPKLILADEPTSALDDSNCTAVITLLKEAASNIDAALIIVTHDSRLKEFVSKSIQLENQS